MIVKAVVHLGDEPRDVYAFEAMDLLEAAGIPCLRVVVKSVLTTPEMLARADVVLDGVDEVATFLPTLTLHAGLHMTQQTSATSFEPTP